MTFIWVAIGGALGAMSRYGISILMKSTLWGTVVVNVVGCAAAAALVHHLGDDKVKMMLLVTGFCGAFTTFSAFSVEVIQLLQSGRQTMAGAYVVINTLLSLGAAIGTWKLMP